MALYVNLSRETRCAVLLGLTALAFNIAGRAVLGSDWLALGNLFLFLAAGTLGPEGTIITAVIGLFPDIALGNRFEALRMLALCLGCSLALRANSRIPLFAGTLAVWALILAPVSAIINPFLSSDPWSASYLAFLFLWDMTLAVLAGCLLLNPNVWATLTARPRHLDTKSVLLQAFSLTALFPAFLMFLIHARSIDSNPWHAAASATGIFLVAIALSFLLANRLTEYLATSSDRLLASTLPPHSAKNGFSGLSKEFWRRADWWQATIFRSAVQKAADATRSELPAVEWKTVSPTQGLCAVTRDGTITFMNLDFRQIAEIAQNEVLGRRLESLNFNPAVYKAVQEVLVDSFARGSRIIELKLNELPAQLRFLRIAGERVSLDENAIGPESVVISIEDITAHRTIELGFLRDQRLTALGTLMQGMGHAFNNVLTTITGQASYARHLNEVGPIYAALDHVVDTCRHAGDLVKQLLDFATVRPIELREEPIAQLLTEQTDLLRRAVGETYELVVDSHAEDQSVRCDGGLVRQLLTHLVLNARESYQSQTGKIWITLDVETIDPDVAKLYPGATAGPCARIRVRDEGRGMHPDLLRKSLDPTKLGSEVVSPAQLSLATAFSLVRAHDGFLTAESHPERGTTVSVYLPLSPQQVSASVPSDRTIENKRNVPRSDAHEDILVVEDDDSIREVVSAMLSTLGYSVSSCRGGEEALEYCSRRSVDLVLVDLVMPRVNGLELVEKLRVAHPKVCSVVMTGSGIQCARDRTGQNIVLAKPFDIEQLGETIRSALDKRKELVGDTLSA